MSLRLALESMASGTRAERELGARRLREELMSAARRLGAPDADDTVQEVLANVVRLCVGGVPSRWPHTDSRVSAFLYVSVRNHIAHARRRAKKLEGLDPSGTPGASDERVAAAAGRVERVFAEQRIAREQDAEWAADGVSHLERALALTAQVVAAVVQERPPRYRAGHIATWNEMTEYYSGVELDAVIAQAGEQPEKKTREQRYTNFKRLRQAMLERVGRPPWSTEAQDLLRYFVESGLTQHNQLSGLRALRIPLPERQS